MKNKHVITIFAVVMLIYQGWRVFDYMGANLTGVSDSVRLVISIAFLAFSEIGLLIWLHVGIPAASTDLQETVATALIWLNFGGSMIIGLGDMLKHNTIYAVDLSAVDPLLFLAPWVMVVLNIAGYLIYYTNDSEAKLERESRRLTHEENQIEIEARRHAVRTLRANKDGLAEKLAPHYYGDITARVEGRTLNRFARQAGQLKRKAAEQAPDPTHSDNGKVYASEAEAIESRPKG